MSDRPADPKRLDEGRPKLVPGLVSVTFRGLPPAEVARRARAAGLCCIEWGGDVHVPPGDLETAGAVRRITQTAGLSVAAYGSYYRAGAKNDDSFEAVLVTAAMLGAPRVRVWAGTVGSAAATAEDREAVASDLRRVADLAASHSIRIVLEYHGNTLTDTAHSALDLLGGVSKPNVRLGWQPNVHTPASERLNELRQVAGHVETVHAFHWTSDPSGVRRWPLQVGASEWRDYVRVLIDQEREIRVLLEFMPDDSPGSLRREAESLLETIRWATAKG